MIDISVEYLKEHLDEIIKTLDEAPDNVYVIHEGDKASLVLVPHDRYVRTCLPKPLF